MDLMERLEHAKGQVHQLQGKVETHDYELVKLYAEICQTQKVKNKVDFMLQHLKAEKDLVVS